MFVSLKTYAALAAVASTNYVSLVSAQVDNAGVIVEGQACEAGEAMMLACADASSLLFCNYNTWAFFSECPQGTVCSNSMCVNDDSVAVSPASSASATAPASSGASSATNGISHDKDDDDGDEKDSDTASSSGSDTAVSSSAAGTADNTDLTSITDTELSSDTNEASDLEPDSDNSNIVDNSDSSDMSDVDSDIVNNIGTLSEFSEFSELDSEESSDDDWFESLKGSASSLPVGTQRICVTMLSTLALSVGFTWIL